MKYLGIESSDLVKLGGIHTAREICQQPELWRRAWEDVNQQEPALLKFMDEALANTRRIILAGAGTSAFIGLSLRGVFQRATGLPTDSVATTDIVSHPKDYLHPDIPTLLISFARSGNSPESVASIALADEICKTCYHLIITCNPDGKLAHYSSKSRHYIFNLPPEANDQSLAMTSSYSTMLLVGLLIAKVRQLKSLAPDVDTLIQYGRKLIELYAGDFREIAQKNFNRAVFLGSGPFFGTATESHLKLQEFTDGKVICKNDSYLGFRHGPKAVVDESTLVVYLLTNNTYALHYEKDLIEAMKKGRPPLLEIGISESAIKDLTLQHAFQLSENGKKIEEELLTVCYILPAQLLGFYKSIALGLMPDAPSATGAITRVVEGVNIYSLT
ncbi:SIS domain-containing protein [Chryseolinea lacunae]|uniref:SIS domain-containing protein n=1 Tax=Chryseolinea lacunae TaxID=2801331 RepID=A0ABS1L0S9_9BACT|nr:SIS domain-containing protein [Chryseolinea lacunae]MBL0745299.1 SIS domain-containing protein [Chryseolinea lacunae]